MFQIAKLFKKNMVSKEEIARLLKTTPAALDAFEKAYAAASFEEEDGLPETNSRKAVQELRGKEEKLDTRMVEALSERIVRELFGDADAEPVSLEEIQRLPRGIRPQLTGRYMKRDISEPSFPMVIDMYANHLKWKDKDSERTTQYYHMFRQGLDIMDLDPVLYEVLGMNRNSIGYWFPKLKDAAEGQYFFKVPKTKIVKVPLPILQLTRVEFYELTPTTLDVVNRWAYEAFGLDENKTYFVKTGTYSSKFDFRNAKVTTPQEVRELGSYLLYIHYQANQMASPFCQPCIYGVSTTNEWCVREYIEDVEGNPCIYHGMPLHTEYRVFIDCDTKEVLGIAPYWRPDIMKNRFANGPDADNADMKHDYVIYAAHEEKLMDRYEKNKDTVLRNVQELLMDLDLTGQWSLDVMQNGTDFWLIDMADASSSALSDCVEKGRIKKREENWLPNLSSEINK